MVDKIFMLRVGVSSTVVRFVNSCRSRISHGSDPLVNANRCPLNVGLSMHNSSDVTSCGAAKTFNEDSLRFRKPVFPVPVVPMRIDDSNPTDGAKELLKIIRPEWPSDRLRFTVLC